MRSWENKQNNQAPVYDDSCQPLHHTLFNFWSSKYVLNYWKNYVHHMGDFYFIGLFCTITVDSWTTWLVLYILYRSSSNCPLIDHGFSRSRTTLFMHAHTKITYSFRPWYIIYCFKIEKVWNKITVSLYDPQEYRRIHFTINQSDLECPIYKIYTAQYNKDKIIIVMRRKIISLSLYIYLWRKRHSGTSLLLLPDSWAPWRLSDCNTTFYFSLQSFLLELFHHPLFFCYSYMRISGPKVFACTIMS